MPISFIPARRILDRYLIQAFVRIFAIALLIITSLYLAIDFFDGIEKFLGAGVSLGTIFKYFFYELPLVTSRVTGFATLFSTLLSLGLLARNQEIIAMRTSGMSLQRLSIPVVLAALAMSLISFLSDETLVPIFTRKAQYIYQVEVKKKNPQGLLGNKNIWIRDRNGFVSVEHFDSKKKVIDGLTIYIMNPDFTIQGLVEAEHAIWDGKGWETKEGREWFFLPDGQVTQKETSSHLPISLTPEDFSSFARDSETLSFMELRNLIKQLKEIGINTTEYDVDLQFKLALPLISPLIAFLAIPFALRQWVGGGMAASFVWTMMIGFSYWVVLSFTISLGHSGVLPPLVSAWLPNVILAMVGLYFFLREE